jgi:hypothetical protein
MPLIPLAGASGFQEQQAPLGNSISLMTTKAGIFIWPYLLDPTESIEANKPVIVRRVDVICLREEDWKYEKSAAGEAGGGRTHTFGVRRAGAKLKPTPSTNAAMSSSRTERRFRGMGVGKQSPKR